MKEKQDCPYCDEFITLDIDDEYYRVPEGCEVEKIECPKCHNKISIDWHTLHRINFSKVD